MSESVLIIDDDSALRRVYRRLLTAEGYGVLEAGDPDAGLSAFASGDVRLVILDLMLPPAGTAAMGAALLPKLLASRPQAKVLVVSGADELSLALDLVRQGAYDFLAKPLEPDVMLSVLARAVARLALEDRVRELEQTLAGTHEAGLLGSAPSFVAARRLAERAATADVPVLLVGESGTGKEVFARYVHLRSRRAAQPFVAINCGAISPQLLESTLFGHRRGAFTGATQDHKGLFLEAHGGSLLLDEIGDLALDLQVKLLRVLESGEVLPLGANKPIQVDVRILSATHRPLAEMVREKAFRDDLYWRIRGIEVGLPSLADRPGDIGLLSQHFLHQARALVPGIGLPRLSASALRCLEDHSWPGNLRELRHELTRALVMAAGRSELLPEDFSPTIARQAPLASADQPQTLDDKVAALERSEITRALAEHADNRSQAATALGLSRQGLLNKMARFGLR